METEKLTMSVKELAACMGISRAKAYELVRRRDFPAVWIGRRVVVPVDSFRRWLDCQAGDGSGARIVNIQFNKKD